jgi:uncharacterized protein
MASDRIWGNSKVTLVLLDTNAIFMIFEFSIDVDSELTRLLGSNIIKIPEAVVHEIEIIGNKGKGKQKNLAKPALQFINRYPQLNHDHYSTADDAILHVASDLGAVVVTNDKRLRDRLKQKGVSRIFLRGKQQLVLER